MCIVVKQSDSEANWDKYEHGPIQFDIVHYNAQAIIFVHEYVCKNNCAHRYVTSRINKCTKYKRKVHIHVPANAIS